MTKPKAKAEKPEPLHPLEALTIGDLHALNQAAYTLNVHRVRLLDQLLADESSIDSVKETIDAVRHMLQRNVGAEVDLR